MSIWKAIFGKSDYESMLSRTYGLELTSAGWLYKGGGVAESPASNSSDPRLVVSFILMQITGLRLQGGIEVKGVCVVEGDPPVIVLGTDKAPFCYRTSLNSDSLGEFAAALCERWGAKVNSQNPGYKGCWLLEKA